MPATPTFEPAPVVARELSLPHGAVAAVLKLLADGNTVPFVARYRKEATGGLDEVQIRAVAARADVLVELEKRRQAVLASIEEQGKLTDELRRALEAAATKAELEDLYLPYRPKRRTRATIARERGLEPRRGASWSSPRPATPGARPRRSSTMRRGCPTPTPRWRARGTSSRSWSARTPRCAPRCVRRSARRAS